MIDRKALLTDLKKQVTGLEGHLRERAGEADVHDRLHGEWQRAREAKRIAATYETWLDDRVTQAAVAWVLGTVFLRFCEDNGLIELPFLAGPGEKLALAQERQADYIRKNPHDTDRDWILAGFAEMSRSPVAAGLFDRAHNPMWQIEIPHHAAKELLAFWRRRGEDGQIVHDFTDPDWDTRFLGDLYQDLSEHAKKTYALLQTPEFVEEFILDHTLEPAIDEFGLAGLRLIDPTCGSGHFLLGAFHRILAKWRAAEPATDSWELIRRTLTSVHGVDKNPFAVSVARFRLLLIAMREGDIQLLAKAPNFMLLIAAGDSLIHGRGAPGVQQELFSVEKPHTYRVEDVYKYAGSDVDLLGVGSYDVVVGNPPYITVKDRFENECYRNAYRSCAGAYSLSVPFMERFFQLAKRGDHSAGSAGYVGQITANSFMKREFGKKLVDEYLATVDITHVIDTSKAYIPGHGTPTLILLGRRRWPREDAHVRAARSINGEVDVPLIPSEGAVWSAIASQIRHPASRSNWISVEDLDRARYFGQHPWILEDGGLELVEVVEKVATSCLGDKTEAIGRTTHTGLDDAFELDEGSAIRKNLQGSCRTLITGEDVRDYSAKKGSVILFPYDEHGQKRDIKSAEYHHFWPNRSLLRDRIDFGRSLTDRGLRWFDHSMFFPKRFTLPRVICFSNVQTHNHFALARGQKLFNAHAPALVWSSASALEEDLGFLALLNSSTACFWLKQVCHDKGNRGGERSTGRYAWESYFEFTAANLQKFPIPQELPIEYGRELDWLANEIVEHKSACTDQDQAITAESLARVCEEAVLLQERMIALQEELDWAVYRIYGLLSEVESTGLCIPLRAVPPLKLGERAFEIAIAREGDLGEAEEQWFIRHKSVPVTDLPEFWPEEYKLAVEKRIDLIRGRRDIGLIERPECKRRWVVEPWKGTQHSMLVDWLLNHVERSGVWFQVDESGIEQPRPLTINELADKLRNHAEFVSVSRLYAGEDAQLSEVIASLVQDAHVPYLAAWRYKESGIRKRIQWEKMWDLQRREDATGDRLRIATPSGYVSVDFRKPSFWRNRGKLDVARERFISYPNGNPDGDSSLLLGWAGWDHRQQAQALMTLIEERATKDGWDAERLTPLVAGLAEVLPWVKQWHGEVDPAFGQSPADAFTTYLEGRQRDLGLSDEALKAWRPKKATKGRAKKA